MFKKIRSRIASATSEARHSLPTPSEGSKKYVLEDVFWVPVHNASMRESNSSPDLRADRGDEHKSSAKQAHNYRRK